MASSSVLTGNDVSSIEAATDASSSAGSTDTRGLEFTISNGEVTAVSEVVGSHTFDLQIPQNATFAVGTGSITETLTGTHTTTVLTFTPESSGASLYQLSSTTTTIASPSTTTANGATAGIDFTIANGATVTGETQSYANGSQTFTHTIHIPADASFTVGSGTVTETLVRGNAVETLNYVQPSGGTLYTLASETTTYVSAQGSTTQLSVQPNDRLEFTIDASGAVTGVERVDADGTTTAITPGSHTSFTQLQAGYVEEINTYGSHTSNEVYYAGSQANGVYTEVAHGSGSTVDVTGLSTQIASLPASVGWII